MVRIEALARLLVVVTALLCPGCGDSATHAQGSTDLQALATFQASSTWPAEWVDDPRILTVAKNVATSDLMGSWAWVSGQALNAIDKASQFVPGGVTTGDAVYFEFLASGIYRTSVYSEARLYCEVTAQGVQVGTYAYDGTYLTLTPAIQSETQSGCNAPSTPNMKVPGPRTYEIAAARYQDGASVLLSPSVATPPKYNTGIVLAGTVCISFDTCLAPRVATGQQYAGIAYPFQKIK
jgi:hypothetical protein